MPTAIGKKILISGGGRCNFTNLHCRPENFLSANPQFLQVGAGSLHTARLSGAGGQASYSYHEKMLGQLFCDRSAQDITSMLEKECRDAEVTIFLKTRTREVRRTMNM